MKSMTFRLMQLVLFAIFSGAWGQENQKLDSLVNLYKQQKDDTVKVWLLNDIISIDLLAQPDKAKSHAKELTELSKKIDFPKGEALGYHRLGGIYLRTGKIDSALAFFKKSYKINQEMENLRGILENNTQLGLLYVRKDEFNKALEYLHKNVSLYKSKDTILNAKEADFKDIGGTYHTLANVYTQKGMYNLALKNELIALDLYTKNSGELYVADAHNSLSSIETSLGNYNKALDYSKEAFSTYEKHNDIFFQILALNNIGVAQESLGRPQQSVDYYEKGIDLAGENGYKDWEALMLNNVGNAYFALDKKEVALLSYRKSIELYEELGEHPGIAKTYRNLGNFFNEMNRPDSAIVYLTKSIDLSNEKRHSSKSYLKRSEIYKKTKKYKLALADFEKYATLTDSMFNKMKSQQIEEMRAIHDTEKKEKQIVLQKNEIDLLEQKEKISNLQKWLLGSGLFLSFTAFGFGFYGIRQKMKRNQLEKEKVDTELAFKKKELTTQALHLAKKNETLETLKEKAKELKSSESGQNGYQQLITAINFDLKDDNNWENFSRYFEEVHEDFNSNAAKKFPEITPNELRLMALLKMNLSSKEIANILNISIPGIKKARQRLRKKMNLSSTDSLEIAVLAI